MMGDCVLDPWFDSPRARGAARIVILSDVANEADDPFAIVHALLTPSFDVRSIVAQHFGRSGSVDESCALADEVLACLPAAGVTVVRGASRALAPDTDARFLSADELAGARAIVDEAMLPDERPLYVLGMGPLTDMALALELEPAVASRCTLVWVGGGRYPHGSHEANLARDLAAAQRVFASALPLWQIPSGAYKTLNVSVAELVLKLGQAGGLGATLMERMRAFASEQMDEKHWIQPESWVLGDNAAVGALLAEQKGCWREIAAPSVGDDCSYGPAAPSARSIRVYDALDSRFILEDMFAKIALFAQRASMSGAVRGRGEE